MFQKIAKHRANDASNDVHRPPLGPTSAGGGRLTRPTSLAEIVVAKIRPDNAGQRPKGH